MNRMTRFIPALAGNTDKYTRYVSKIAVYPRSRGEHAVQRLQRVFRGGLSPLSRGTRR